MTRLGADGIYVELAGEAFELRPSLRASMRLVRRHGLPGLLAAVQGFNITVIADVLLEAGIKPSLMLADIAAIGLKATRHRLTEPLAAFVLAVAGIDPNDTAQPAPSTDKPIDPQQVFAQLFGIATGALGWTPEEAWNATPTEIVAAHNGQTAHLIRTGVLIEQAPADEYTPERLKQIEEQGFDPAFDREGLAALRGIA